ncbi:MAG: hypothetical protein ACE5KZ_16410 [Candidatus Scalinduaceae bacterium]
MKKFEVNIYYSSFCTYEVEAENMDGAIKKARKININENDILTNLENWEEADAAVKIA